MNTKAIILLAFLFGVQHISFAKDKVLTITEGITYSGKIDKKTNTPNGLGVLYFDNYKSIYSAHGYFQEDNIVTHASLQLPSGWSWSGDTIRYEIQDSTVTFQLGKGHLHGFLSLTRWEKKTDPTKSRQTVELDATGAHITVSRNAPKIVETNIRLLSEGYTLINKPRRTDMIYDIPSKCIGLDSIEYADGALLRQDDIVFSTYGSTTSKRENQWSLVPSLIFISDKLKPIYNEENNIYEEKESEGIFDYILNDKYFIKRQNSATLICDSNGLEIQFHPHSHPYRRFINYKKAGSDFEFSGWINENTGIVSLHSGTYQGKKIKDYHLGDDESAAQIKVYNINTSFQEWMPEVYTGMVNEDENHSESAPLICMKGGKDMMPAYIAGKKQKEKYESEKRVRIERVRKSLAGTKWSHSSKTDGATMNANITLQANGRAVGTVTLNMKDYVPSYRRVINMNMVIHVDIPWEVMVSRDDESSYVVSLSRDDIKTGYKATGNYVGLMGSSERGFFEYGIAQQIMSKFWGYFPLSKNYQNIGNLKRVK